MSWTVKTKGGYEETSAEALNNSTLIYQFLAARGWSLNAVCGILGNIGHESGYNPWRWQSDQVLSSTSPSLESTSHGYGLFQFTPFKNGSDARYYYAGGQKYSGYGPNYSDKAGSVTDAEAQLMFMNANDSGGYIPTQSYPLSFAQYKTSTDSAADLASAWLRNYERPASFATEGVRRKTAEYWFAKLSGTPTPSGRYVNVLVEGNGSAWAVPTNAESGTKITLYEVPGEGATFLGWTVLQGGVAIATDNTFTLPDSDVYIKARFTGKQRPQDFKPWLLYYFQNGQTWASLNIV